MQTHSPQHLIEVLGRSPVLSIAHPGHELHVYGITCLTRPLTLVLTDGSGSDGQPRIDSARAVLGELCAPFGTLFGGFNDRAFYELILHCNVPRLAETVREVAGQLVQVEATSVYGDAIEGFSTAHDLFRDMTNLAVRLAAVELKRPIGNFVFPLVGSRYSYNARQPDLCMRLGDDVLGEKLVRACTYRGLEAEVTYALEQHGPAALRHECLWLEPPGGPLQPGTQPAYELFGQQRVASGRYKTLITGDHVRTVSRQLWNQLAPP